MMAPPPEWPTRITGAGMPIDHGHDRVDVVAQADAGPRRIQSLEPGQRERMDLMSRCDSRQA